MSINGGFFRPLYCGVGIFGVSILIRVGVQHFGGIAVWTGHWFGIFNVSRFVSYDGWRDVLIESRTWAGFFQD